MNINNKSIEKLVIATLTLLALLFLFLTLYFAKLFFYGQSLPDAPSTISVTATGEVKAVPNIATFSFSAVETGKDVNEAQNKMADVANKAIDFVKSEGVDPKDIQTSNYSANPKYEYTQTKQVLTGYEARETITVKVRDSSKTGDILSGVGKLGVSELSGLSFESEDPTELKQLATEDALKKAKEKADRLAVIGGFKIVKFTGFYEEVDNQPGPIMYDKAVSAMAAPAVPPQIQPGENTINSTITVTYEIK